MLSGLLLALALQGSPEAAIGVISLDPASIHPYEPAVIEITGKGLKPSCRVMIDKQRRFVPVKTEFVDESRVRAVLSNGLGPEPSSRRLVVRCGRERSAPLELRIVAGQTKPEGHDGPSEAAESGQAIDQVVKGDAQPVTIDRLDPEGVVAGEVFTLTLTGTGFQQGATVEVLANANAGTSRVPQYESLSFDAEVASDTVLIVDFERGFAASPQLRSVVVKNPDGGESLPAYFKILRRSP